MQKISVLYDASQAVLSTFDLDQVLNQILTIARDYFRLQNGAIMLLDPETQQLRVRAWLGSPTQASDVPSPVGEGISGSAVKLKRPIYSPDVTKDERYVTNIPTTRSELAIPLMVRDEVVGVLDLQQDEPAFFDKATIDLLTLFSTQASIALQNARLYSSERRRAAQLQAINNIVRRATAVLHMDELLDTVCEQVLQNFPIENVAIVLIEGGKLIYRRHRGTLRPYLQEGDVVPEGGLCTRALSTRDAVVEREVSKAPDYIAGCDGAEGEICLPLISFGEPLGVLVLDSARTDAFESQDVKALQAVADICATAIQNARHFERARSLANLDGLTGIYNRRYFEERVADEMLRAVRYKSTFSVVMLDIDSFKKLNDEFGHLLGDEVLRQFAQIFTQNLRKVDIACRYGGEEFAIVLPETDGAKAVKVAEKLRQITEQWRFPGVPRPVTISAGIAEFRRNGHTRDEVVGAADAALYAAKQQGRNRVIRAAAANAAATHAND